MKALKIEAADEVRDERKKPQRFSRERAPEARGEPSPWDQKVPGMRKLSTLPRARLWTRTAGRADDLHMASERGASEGVPRSSAQGLAALR